ncbi:uncharacterized protein Z519_08596 [Cladophialophora bantiana CBS 173.52]|uniref:Acyl-CoA dehydrogenase/oxidase C-terminal domain-containing protein n=1 Tax=Cladophialophora bantiana (strain ATCC 10958 / CBS 173.52 / CDC B-1940 / NIH 8579) TaxID=1442370 RepID=A0A0D2HBZ7_CLAB1|nr:uncharacterized protein Z519_08596 [Cladophialophora bantiana CBS 173.52]KIW90813.1 hypothetical protein Z519_08596 [Cladophialophora bantiana CBS 173.52]
MASVRMPSIIEDKLRPHAKETLQLVKRFVEEECIPVNTVFEAQLSTYPDQRWKSVPPILEDLKQRARQLGLWNPWMHSHLEGPSFTKVKYTFMCETMSRSLVAPEAMNCSAPNTGNMEINRFARSNPDDPNPLKRHSIILVDAHTKDIDIIRPLQVSGFGGGSPATSEISRGLTAYLIAWANTGKINGAPLADKGLVATWIPQSRIDIDAALLLTLNAADKNGSQQRQKAKSEIATAKIQVPNLAWVVMNRAIQAHDVAGLCQDFPFARIWPYLRMIRFAHGPDEAPAAQLARTENKRHRSVSVLILYPIILYLPSYHCDRFRVESTLLQTKTPRVGHYGENIALLLDHAGKQRQITRINYDRRLLF